MTGDESQMTWDALRIMQEILYIRYMHVRQHEELTRQATRRKQGKQELQMAHRTEQEARVLSRSKKHVSAGALALGAQPQEETSKTPSMADSSLPSKGDRGGPEDEQVKHNPLNVNHSLGGPKVFRVRFV
jgi:hypothetical protein